MWNFEKKVRNSCKHSQYVSMSVCPGPPEIPIWDAWSFANVYRLGFRSEMLFWRLFRSVILTPHLNNRESCLLSTLSPFLLSSKEWLRILKLDLGNLSKSFKFLPKCSLQFWIVFSLKGMRWRYLRSSCQIKSHWIEIQLIHVYEFCEKCLLPGSIRAFGHYQTTADRVKNQVCELRGSNNKENL